MDEETGKKLQNLAIQADTILHEELAKTSLSFEKVEVRVYNVKSVGVAGDARSYAYPAEVTLSPSEGRFWDPDFLSHVSLRITNEVRDINRVTYFLASLELEEK